MKNSTRKINNLAVFLAIGESLHDFKSKGQLKRLVNYNLKSYSQKFDQVYVFSYENEKTKLFSNCTVIPNKYRLHRYLYSLLLPILERQLIKKCSVSRGLQLTGGIPALVTKLLFQIPYVVNYGYDYVEFAKIEGKYLQSVLYSLIIYPILALANAVIATSKTNAKIVAKSVGSAKVRLIPNGVDLKLFKPLSQNKRKDIITIGFIGRLEKQKNLENLILACSRVHFPYQLEFWGAGAQKSALLKLAKTKKVNLEILPPQEYRKLPEILAKIDIFALISKTEGNPKILIEAMAAAKSIVASDIPGIDNIVKNNTTGLLTKTDAKSISVAISRLKQSDIRSKLGSSARLYIQNNYDIEILQVLENNLLLSLCR